LESDRLEKEGPISNSLQARIDDLERKKSVRMSLKGKRGSSKSPQRDGSPGKSPGGNSFLPDISPSPGLGKSGY